MLDTDRQTDIALIYTCRFLFLGRQLRMRCRSRMNGQRTGITDIGDMMEQFQRVDKGFTCFQTTFQFKPDKAAIATFEILIGTARRFGILNAPTKVIADRLVDYTRGQDDAGLRTRTLDFFNNNQAVTLRLGDIVQSTPTVAATPAEAFDLLYDDEKVYGVKVKHKGEITEMRANSVVLACGGFEANSDWRTRYMGPGWDLVKVRGTRHNMGAGIKMALDIGAMPYGNWSGGHAVGWDLNAPEFGDLAVGDNFQKHSYPLGVMVNAKGKRFVDEGADFRNYTYAKYGKEILNQPAQFAWQIFDQKVTKLLRDEYRIKQMTKVTSDTLEGLVEQLEGVDAAECLKTLNEYNDAVMDDVRFNPAVLDGRGTKGLSVPKTNWANKLDEPPYEAYAITCGITFTFGGLRIDGEGRVLDTDLQSIPGLHAAGELVGGLFYFNYAGGTGLMNGSVFGRIAGATAAGMRRNA